MDQLVHIQLLEAIHFAAIKHTNQRRKDPAQTPYINHPIGVARILTHEGGVTDLDTLIAAILHDTVEDTDTSFQEIEALFGASVAALVAEVTDDKNLLKADRKRLQIEKAPTASAKAKLVKLADKIHNLRSIGIAPPVGWSEQRVQEYFEWAEKVTNGCRGVNPQLDSILDAMYADRRLKQQ
ncbi:HD domain-containing 3 [Obelidium mucronatum]|nr:HD domain-containing 3 [Obelidium mucronatum]